MPRRSARHERYNPFGFDYPIQRNPGFYPQMDYAMRSFYDTSRIATYGLVTAGTIGIIGSILHR